MKKNIRSKAITGTPSPWVETNPEAQGSETPEPQAKNNTPAKDPEPVADEPIEEGVEINKLLDEGYSVKQIIDLGFNRRTTYHYAKLRTKPEHDPNNATPAAAETTAIAGKHELMKLGARDVIPPESIVDAMIFPKDGAALEVWKEGYASCLWQILGVARLLQVLSAGQADIVTSQLQLWQEAKNSSRDIASEAAEKAASETAGQMSHYLDQKLARKETPAPTAEPTLGDRIMGPMADMAGKQMANMFGKMFGGLPGMGEPSQPGQENQVNVPSGWGYKKSNGGK